MMLLTQLLWTAMFLLFLVGAITYAFRPHLGLDLLKRAGILLIVVLIGPSLLLTVFAGIPMFVLVLLGVAACFAAYGYVTHQPSKHGTHGHGSSSHSERRPQVPHTTERAEREHDE